MKNDTGKLRMDLIPPEAVRAMAEVLAAGAAKYSDRGWETGTQWSRYYAALQRHLLAWWSREPCDDETGLSHLSHALCCATFLVTYEARCVGVDDRPVDRRETEPGPAAVRDASIARCFDGYGAERPHTCLDPSASCLTRCLELGGE